MVIWYVNSSVCQCGSLGVDLTPAGPHLGQGFLVYIRPYLELECYPPLQQTPVLCESLPAYADLFEGGVFVGISPLLTELHES
jgi:hypothetical protein